MYECLRFLILLLYNVSAYDYQLNLALNYQIILKAMTNKCWYLNLDLYLYDKFS